MLSWDPEWPNRHRSPWLCERHHGRNRSDVSDDKIVMRELRQTDGQLLPTHVCTITDYQRATESNCVYVTWIHLLKLNDDDWVMNDDDDECGGVVRCNIILSKIWSSKIQAAFLQLGSKQAVEQLPSTGVEPPRRRCRSYQVWYQQQGELCVNESRRLGSKSGEGKGM